ncbi:MAG: Gldg family protein [Proteobacteria bacterium]|nr:Gldg family protein [Pseudomonadota bacterium]
MPKLLTWLRLPILLIGVILLFIADRYLGTESYHNMLRYAGIALVGLSLLFTLALGSIAAGRNLRQEATGWRLLTAWQLLLLAALGAYVAYVKVLGQEAAPSTPLAKVLLGAWLVLGILAFATGVGGEWAMRTTGRGDQAEPLRVKRASLAWLAVGMLLAFLGAVNYAASVKDKQRDWSYLKVNTPSESTLHMVKTLSSDLNILMFYPQGNEVRTAVVDYVAAVAAANPHVKITWHDKDADPVKAEEYRVTRNGQIVLDLKGKKSRIDTGTTLAKARSVLKTLDSEFQKSFLEATAEKKTLYFTRGHGESTWIGEAAENPLRSLRTLSDFLRQQNYTTRMFGVTDGSLSAVPDDASAVLIIGPTSPFQKEEVEALRTYVQGGGNVFIAADIDKPEGAPLPTTPTTPTTPGTDPQPLYALLTQLGLTYHAEPLGNERNHYPATHSPADIWVIFSNVFTSHESVVSLARHDERVGILLFQSGYWSVGPGDGKWKVSETVRALTDTFADTNRNYQFDAGEKREAFVIGAVAELKAKPTAPKGKVESHQGRVALFADASAFSDALVRNIGNALYFSDTLKWLVGDTALQGELANEEDVKIRHTRKEDVIWFHATVVVVPLLVLGIGFLATRRRKVETSEKVSTDAA